MKTQKLFGLLVAVVMLLSLLAACTTPEPAPPDPTEPPVAEPTDPPAEEPVEPEPEPEPEPEDPCAPAEDGPLAGVDPRGVEVVWWHNHSRAREEGLLEMVAEFNATNECGINVVAENQGGYNDIRDKMNVGIATGELPGLVVGYQNDQAFYALANGLADIAPYMDDAKWGLTDEARTDFYASFLEQGVHEAFGGQQLGFPPNRSMEVIFYNVTWAEELGFDGPPESPEDFREMACAAADTGAGGYIIRTDASALAAWTLAFGGNILDATGTGYNYDNPSTIAALTFLQELYNDGCAYFFTEGYPNPELANRRALFTQGSTSGIPFYLSDLEAAGSEDVIDIAPIPHTTAAPVQNVYGGDIMIPNTNPQTQLAAWLFLKWFTEPEQQAWWVQISDYFPTRASTMDYLEDYLQENTIWAHGVELLPYGQYEPQLISYQSVRDAAEQAMNEIFQGADVETTLSQLNENANDLQAELMD